MPVRAPATSRVDGKAFPLGSIIRIELKNFMCHDHLVFNLSPRINFLIGANGSGKSAVMNAITLGLGGRAQFTDRSNSTSSFVQDGAPFAEIKISLSNRPDGDNGLAGGYVYSGLGKTITIIRRITSSSSTYKILAHDGRVVSNKADLLASLRQRLRIELDNPICMLNQESSKCLMSSTSPVNLYKVLKQLEERAEQLNQIFLRKKTTEQLRRKLVQLKKELNSSRVKRQLQEVVAIKDRLCEFQKEIDKSTGESVAADSVALNQELQEVRAKLDALKGEELESLNKQRDDAGEKLAACRQIESAASDEVARLRQAVERKVRELSDLEDQFSQKGRNDFDPEAFARLQGEISTLTVRLDECRSTAEIESRRRSEWSSTLESVRNELTSNQIELNNLLSRVSQMRQGQADKTKRFGTWVPQILKKLDQNRSTFRQMPIGPIGLLVKLKSSQWSTAVERCLQSQLRSFLCFDYADEKALRNMLGECVPSSSSAPRLIVSHAKSLSEYDTTKFRPRIDLPVVLDVLDFEDSRVACALIDESRIDTSVLCADRHEAIGLIQDGTASRANVRRIFTQDGTEIIPGSGRSFRLYACPPSVGSLLGSKDVSEDVEATEREINRLKEANKLLERRIAEHRRVEPLGDGEYRRRESLLQNELDRLQSQLDTMRAHERRRASADHTTFLQTETRVIEQEIARLKQQLCEQNTILEQNRVSLNVALEERETIKEKLSQHCQEIMSLKSAESRLEDELRQIETWQDSLQERVTRLRTEHEKMSEHLKIAEEHYKVMKREVMAKDGCILETDRSVGIIESEIAEAEGRLKACEASLLAQDTSKVESELEALKSKIEQGMLTLNRDYRQIKTLEAALEKRKRSHLTFRQHLGMKCDKKFAALLACRDFHGKLSFDHEQELLHVQIGSKDHDTSAVRSDIRALSGGERSFSTVCFLLSMWDTVSHPFRCLDEFDVFMDQINVEVVSAMLVEAARRMKRTQFLFISPQGTSVKPEEGVAVLKMPNPKRLC